MVMLLCCDALPWRILVLQRRDEEMKRRRVERWDLRREKRKAKGEKKKRECWIRIKPWLAYIKILWFKGAAADKKCTATYSSFLTAELRSEFTLTRRVKVFRNTKNTTLITSSWPCKFLCEVMRSHRGITQLLLYHEKFNDIRRCSINIPTCEGWTEESEHMLSVWTSAAVLDHVSILWFYLHASLYISLPYLSCSLHSVSLVYFSCTTIYTILVARHSIALCMQAYCMNGSRDVYYRLVYQQDKVSSSGTQKHIWAAFKSAEL